MEPKKPEEFNVIAKALSRRNLFKGAAALGAASAVPAAFGQQPTGAPFGTVWVYIGTYTGAPGPRGSSGQGIYLGALNLFNGQLTIVRLVAPVVPAAGVYPSTASPSTIALDPSHTHLYAGNEIGPPGAVSAYAINRSTGDLTLLNVQPAIGAPAYVGVDATGRYLFAAEYSGSTFEVFPIMPNGSLAPAQQSITNVGNIGPKNATNAPPGSFAISAHEGSPHPHMLQNDPSNQWVLGCDAGQDRIYVFKLNVGGSPPLTPAATPFVNTPPGDGPRHFAFHPNGVWMYSIQEEASTIMFWNFNPVTGALSPEQIISSLPPGFAGTDFTSEIRVSNDGRFVYGANRLNDTIGVFSIGFDGRLTQVSHASTLGDYPRTFAFDPFGLFMAVANQSADNVTTFRINLITGELGFTGFYTPVGSPSGMVFLS